MTKGRKRNFSQVDALRVMLVALIAIATFQTTRLFRQDTARFMQQNEDALSLPQEIQPSNAPSTENISTPLIPNFHPTVTNRNNVTGLPAIIEPSSHNSLLPHLYIHIGPHKTGSTSLQDILAIHGNRIKREDNVAYIGKINREVMDYYDYQENERTRQLDKAWIHATKDTKRQRQQRAMGDLRMKLQECYATNTSVLMSNEEFSHVQAYPDNLRKLVKALDTITDGMFEVHVVMVYRNYEDWIWSLYNFEATYQKEDWPEENLEPKERAKKRVRLEVAQAKLDRIRTLPVYKKKKVKDAQPISFRQFMQQRLFPYEDAARLWTFPDNWKLHLIDLQHLQSAKLSDNNWYQGALPLDFLCHVVEKAPNTCQYLSNQESVRIQQYESNVTQQFTSVVHRRSNTGKLLAEYDRMIMYLRYDCKGEQLTTATRRKQLYWAMHDAWQEYRVNRTVVELPWSVRQQWVTNGISQTLNRIVLKDSFANNQNLRDTYLNNHVIPLECPTADEYVAMWKTTIEGEQFVMQNANEKRTRKLDELRAKHEQAIQQYKYCQIDLDVLHMEGSPWIPFITEKMRQEQKKQAEETAVSFVKKQVAKERAEQRGEKINRVGQKPW